MNGRRYTICGAILCVVLALVCASFFVGTIAHAQTVDITPNDIDLETNPEVPEPNQQVTATLTSYVINLNNYQISWFVDRTLQRTDVGIKSFTFTTGNQGTTTQLEAQINIDGQIVSKVLQISPTNVDILWEANTYVPPFYKGKKLASREAQITVTAIPQFSNPTQDSIRTGVYYWNRNFNPITDMSGYGKQSFTFDNSPIKSTETISVIVKNRTETEVAQRDIDLPFRDPFFVYYPKNGSRVKWTNGSRGGFVSDEQLFELVVSPYYLLVDNINNVPFSWSTSTGSQLSILNPLRPNEMNFQIEGQRGASVRINTTTEHTQKLLQTGSGTIEIVKL